MRKNILFILTAFISLSAFGQAKLQTKQYTISDFREKTMKVVLSGNEMTDAALRENIQSVWSISPYEFCSEEEFEASKSNPDFYFLTIVDSRRRKETEPGLKFIGIYKGTASAKDISSLYKVVNIPFCPSENPDGREMVMLPAILNILQNQVCAIMDRKLNVGDMVMVDLKTMTQKWDRRCAIARADFSQDPDLEAVGTYAEANVDVVDHDAVEKYLTGRAGGVLVGYVVAPFEPVKGSVCYTMLIDADSWDIWYIKKRKISQDEPAGFTAKEVALIMRHDEKK